MPTTQITLTGNYGTTATGFVDVERRMALTLAGTVYPPTIVRVPLVAGAFSKVVDATDDPGVSPLNAYYTITEYLNGGKAEKNIFVPYNAAGATVDVNTAVPVSATAVLVFTPPAGSVGPAELAANAVTTPKILDAAVTPAKLDRAYVVSPGISGHCRRLVRRKRHWTTRWGRLPSRLT